MTDRPFYIAGAGRVATAFARWLPEAGFNVSGWGARRPEVIKTLSQSAVPAMDLQELSGAVSDDGIVLICVSDHAIADVASQFDPAGGYVLHVSGLYGAAAMKSVGRERRLAFHPVVSFPQNAFARIDSPFVGAVCTLEGGDDACAFGRELATRLGASAVRLSEGQKSALHAASALLANMTVVLAHAFEEITTEHDIRVNEAREIRIALLESVQSNLCESDARQALTGPVARGDVDTVRAHLALLRERTPGLVEVYTILSRRALDIVRSGHEIPEERLNDLERLLS